MSPAPRMTFSSEPPRAPRALMIAVVLVVAPIGATIVRGFVHDTIVEEFGAFAHVHTYIRHATACAAAYAVARVVHQDDLLTNVSHIGALMRDELSGALADHPLVGDIRGRGLLLGIELVADRDSKAPADPGLAPRIKSAAMQEGLIIYPGSGTADGILGAHILLAPPFIYETTHVDELVTKLVSVFDRIGNA